MTGVPKFYWRPRWYVATTTMVSFAGGFTGLGYLIWTGDGDPVLVPACLTLIAFGLGIVGLDSLRDYALRKAVLSLERGEPLQQRPDTSGGGGDAGEGDA